jgi:short-subunit dehydrogenase
MKILLTGSSSGVGQMLNQQLSVNHNVTAPTRQQLDLLDSEQIINFVHQSYDMLINCAGTGIGGKIDFVNHNTSDIQDIIQTNLVAPVLLSQAVFRHNLLAKIVNITSTNNLRYWPNDLAYSLSKKAVEEFGKMLMVEYPSVKYLEVRLGLTKTNFNQNRFKNEPSRYSELYQNNYLTPENVANTICNVLFDDTIKFIEISP